MSDRIENGLRPVRCLSFHADYACENTGICCSSGWDIAVEQPVELHLRSRLLDRADRLPNGPDGFVPLSEPPSGCHSALRRDESGTCWFRDNGRRDCAIHREFGEESLASACRQFPRIAVLEPAQVSISLSHYCPTAAALLFREAPDFAIVENPRAFPQGWPFEGLDAREAYSPLLRPGVLLGYDGLRALEQEAVNLLSKAGADIGLARIENALRRIGGWTPEDGQVAVSVARAFRESKPRADHAAAGADPRTVLRRSVPAGATVPDLPASAGRPSTHSAKVDLALRRYLAARLVGGWILFQADDLNAVARYLRLCLNTVRLFEADRPRSESELSRWQEAIRSADLWLLHYCDPELLARNLG